MASRESAVFEWVSKALEEATQLSTAQARGTIRIVLRKGGLEPSSVVAADIKRMLNEILPWELSVRGYDDADDICRMLAVALAAGLSAGSRAG